MRVKRCLASQGRQCPAQVVIWVPKRCRGGLYRSGMANRLSPSRYPRRFVSNRVSREGMAASRAAVYGGRGYSDGPPEGALPQP